MPEESGGGGVDGEVEGFPEVAAESNAEIRSGHNDGDDVEGGGADGVFERLAGGVYGIEQIDHAEFCGLVEEQNDGMDNGEGEGDVAGDIVKAKIIEAAMRPLADGAVAENHERAEEHVEGDGADGGEADVGGEVEDGDVERHRVVGRKRANQGNAKERQMLRGKVSCGPGPRGT